MIVSLIGFMGAGKTTAGRRLAEKTGCRFIDLDCQIEKQCGKSISALFSELGESGFREIEAACLREVLESAKAEDNCHSGRVTLVLATGGGTPLRPENRELLKSETVCVWLKTSFSIIEERLSHSGSRPLLKTCDPLTLYKEREALYASLSDITVQ